MEKRVYFQVMKPLLDHGDQKVEVKVFECGSDRSSNCVRDALHLESE